MRFLYALKRIWPVVECVLFMALVGTILSVDSARTQQGPNTAFPLRVTTLGQTNGTISVTNTYQQALAARTTRNGCLIYNNGTHTMLVYFGAIASATTSNGLPVTAGTAIYCSTPYGAVLTDAVNITGTAGDAFIVLNQ